MDDGSVTSDVAVAMRLARLSRDLSAVRRDLESITPQLRERIFIRLGTRIYQEQQRLEALQNRFHSDRNKEKIWEAVTSFERSLRELFEECLALIEGAAVRQIEGPGLFCSMADAIVDDILSNIDMEWKAFTVPATSEFFSGSSRVIRVRYPSMSIWDLPIVAHELAHFVVPALSSQRGDNIERPFEQLMDATKQTEQGKSHFERLNEIFADMFAAYVCGPAYLLSCILLRFDPVNATRASFRYPAEDDRVLAITEVFRGSDYESYRSIVDFGLEAWKRAMLNSGDTLPDTDQQRNSEYMLRRILDILEEYLPFARFSGLDQARSVSDRLERAISDSSSEEDMYYRLPENTRPVHLLNGAWLARLRSPDLSEEVERLTRAALKPPAGAGWPTRSRRLSKALTCSPTLRTLMPRSRSRPARTTPRRRPHGRPIVD